MKTLPPHTRFYGRRNPFVGVFVVLAVLAVLAVPFVLFGAVWLLLLEAIQDRPYDRVAKHLAKGYDLHDFEMTGEVTALGFSPDGKHLVAGTTRSGNKPGQEWTGDLKVWNAETQEEKHSLTLSQWIHSVSFTPDGKYLAVACSTWASGPGPHFRQKPGEVRIYEFPAMKEFRVLEFETLVDNAGFSPDGRTLAVLIDSSLRHRGPWALQLLSFPALEKTTAFRDKLVPPVFAFSPDSKEIAFADADPKDLVSPPLKRFDCETGEVRGVVIDRTNPGMHLEWHGEVLMQCHNGIYFLGIRNLQLGLDMRRQIATRREVGTYLKWATMSNDLRYLLAVEAQHHTTSFVSSKVLLEDYQSGELAVVFEDPNFDGLYQRCVLSPDTARFAVGTGQYVGVRGKRDDPRRGHVLLFDKQAAAP